MKYFKKLPWWFIILFLPLHSYAYTGIYITALGGYAIQSSLPSASATGASNRDDSVISAWRTAIGYNHDFNRYYGLGFEIAYGQYGKAQYTFSNPANNLTVRSRGLGFLFSNVVHATTAIDVLFKIGLQHHYTQATVTPFTIRKYKSTNSIVLALGAGYNFNKHFGLMALYSHVFGKKIANVNNINCSSSINAVLVGLKVMF